MSNSFNLTPKACADELARVGLTVSTQGIFSHSTGEFVTDSRKVAPGCIFLAYAGVSFDTHSLLGEIANQQPALIIHAGDFQSERVASIKVKDARAAWAQLASLAFQHPGEQLNLVAVTGTNGKTSTVHFIRQLLGPTCASIGTLGAFIGDVHVPTTHTTPDPPELYKFLRDAVAAGCSTVAMEASSHALVQGKLFPLRFKVGVFTSFARDHLDLHGTLENYWIAKETLFTELMRPDGHAILSTSVKQANALHTKIKSRVKEVISYGTHESDAKILNIAYEADVTYIKLLWRSRQVSIACNLFGDFACHNLLAAELVRTILRKKDTLETDLRFASPPRGRLELVAATQPKVFVDYSHTPDAITTALTALRPATVGKLWIVFGCGGNRDAGKRPLMAQAAAKGADKIILTTDNPRFEDPMAIIKDAEKGFSRELSYHVEVNRAAAIEFAVSHAEPDDTVLIAGKGHETYMEVRGVREHFDDLEVARLALNIRGKA